MNTPATSPRLTPDQMHAVLTDWHAQYVDDPLYTWLSVSFEEMADHLSRAEKCLKNNQEESAWSGCEIPGFGDLRGQFDALTVYGRAA